jgi:hypothetical protein
MGFFGLRGFRGQLQGPIFCDLPEIASNLRSRQDEQHGGRAKARIERLGAMPDE